MPTPSAAPLPSAPIWRRFAAAAYDCLFLLALWLSGTLLAVVVQELLALPPGTRWQHAMRIYYFLIGLLFFGWCWTHGGQTPGMRVWRLRMQREDGHSIRWPVAAVRYVATLLCWTVTLLPLLAAVPVLRAHFHLLLPAGWIGLVLLAGGTLWTRFDPRRRGPQDRIAGTVMLTYPKHSAVDSTQARQQPGRNQHQQHGRRTGGQ